MTASTETLDLAADSAPQALPYHSNTSTLRSADSPKREATEIYLKSKALLDSRRRCLAERRRLVLYLCVCVARVVNQLVTCKVVIENEN